MSGGRSSAATDGRPDSRESVATSGFRVRRGAKALVTSYDRVALVRERHADGTPFWTLPGGGSHPGESLAETLRRELAEELSCRCAVMGPRGAFWYVHRTRDCTVSVYTVFDCAFTTRLSPSTSEGIEEVRWVEPSTPPARTLPAVRSVLEQVVG